LQNELNIMLQECCRLICGFSHKSACTRYNQYNKFGRDMFLLEAGPLLPEHTRLSELTLSTLEINNGTPSQILM